MQQSSPTLRRVLLAAEDLCLFGHCAGSGLAQSVAATITLTEYPGSVAINPATELAYVPVTGIGLIDAIGERTNTIAGTFQ